MAHDDQTFEESIRSLSAVGSLAVEVVSVLNARQGRAQRGVARPYISAILEKRVVSRAAFDPVAVLDELRAFRLRHDEIVDQYIPAAAIGIGQKWVASELGFAEVTIASVRLQSLLSEAAYADPIPSAAGALDCLIVTCEGEQHTLGSFVLSAQLRRKGAIVDMLCGEARDSICDQIAAHPYDVVMFSCSRSRDLDSIAEIVKQSRQSETTPPVFALGGIISDCVEGLERRTGVDLVTCDLDEVAAYCAQRSAHKLKRAVR